MIAEFPHKHQKGLLSGCEWRAFGCKAKEDSSEWRACGRPIVKGTKLCQRHRVYLHGLKDCLERKGDKP